MPFKFNPFSGNFDQTGSGGGDAAPFAGQVDAYADLPLDGSAALNSRWLVKNNSGTWPFSSYKQAGIYIRVNTAGASRDTDYQFVGTLPSVMNDSEFLIYDDADATKNLKFQLSAITTGTTRTISVPDANITIDDFGDTRDPNAHAASHLAEGSDPLFDQDLSTTDDVEFSRVTATTKLIVKQVGGASVANPDPNAVVVIDSATAPNFWFNLRPAASPANATIGWTENENYHHGIIYTSGDNRLTLTADGASANPTDGLAIDASNNVGVGVMAPESKLDINGNVIIRDTENETTATFNAQGNLTDNRTYDLPDASGTLALLSNFLGAVKDISILAPSSDMSVTSSITVADVAGMSFAAAANTSYLYFGIFYIDVGAGAHQIELYVDSLLNGSVHGWGFHIGGQNAVLPNTGISSTNIRLNRAAGGNTHTGPCFTVGGFRTVSSGTVKVQFSQASSNGAASILKGTSRLLLMPVTT